MKKMTATILSVALLVVVPMVPSTAWDSLTAASEDSIEFNEENFFVVVGTSGGQRTQLRYLYAAESGGYHAEKVFLSNNANYQYGDILTSKDDVNMTRVQSAPDNPVYAMAYHYILDENTDLTKVGNCNDLLEKKMLTVTDALYDGSGHWSYYLTDAAGAEYYYGLNTVDSALAVDLTEAMTGDVCLFAMYHNTPVIPMSISHVDISNEPVTEYIEPIMKGDLNSDGSADILDVIKLNKVLLGVEKLSDEQNDIADVDGDGQVTTNDSLALLKQVLGIEQQAPVERTVNLSASYAAQAAQTVDIDEQTLFGQTKFALDLLRESAEPGKNSLVSPYSVSQTLGMTANGAANNTLQEMETVLGGSMETLNPAFYTLRTRDTKDAKCLNANSIWMRDRYFAENPVNPEFLQTNADYYGADVFTAPFDDSTLDDINNWVNDKTDNMIPAILDEIPDDAAMYLVNAVAFYAEWDNPYSYSYDGQFTAADGTEQAVKMMNHDNYNRYYYETAHGVGFRENYKGGQYYFAAFLPETGMTPEEYLSSMTAEELHETLQNPKMGRVYSVLPKFTYDFDIELSGPLSTMGMPSAFLEGPESDFSRIYADNSDRLYISKVLHKTHIEVSELGTRAGAATAVELTNESSADAYMSFNRPFLYMIADSETNLPVFIGIVNSVA